MASLLIHQWTQLKTELSANLRLRLGLWVVVLILGWLWIAQAKDLLNAQQAQKRAAQGRLAHVQTVAAEKDWDARALEAEAQMQQLRARVWTAETKGLAQASLQSWGDNLLTTRNIGDARNEVSADPEVAPQSGVVLFRGRLRGQFEPRQFSELLSQVETSSSAFVVLERLDVAAAEEGLGRFEVVYRVAFTIIQGEGGLGG